MTTKEFIDKAIAKHGHKYDYSKTEYKNYREKICIICPEHGEFWQTPKDHLSGRGCPVCRYASSSLKLRDTAENFILKAKKVYGDRYCYDRINYVNNHTKVNIVCEKHGEFLVTPNNFLNGHGCPICGIESRAEKQAGNTENFIKQALHVHGDKYDYSKVKYVNSRTKVCIICPEHGEFWQTPDSHINQIAGCPKCRSSLLENEIEKMLIENGIVYEKEKTFEWLKCKKRLRLDFYLPDYKIAIECQGIQHFEPIKAWGGEHRLNDNRQRDTIKLNLCKKKGIKVLYFAKTKRNKDILANTNELIKEIKNYAKNK